jgi:NAD(P)-dependent dehydrogenase (short-subunit alcohol dehydrogenase family)
MAAAMEAAMEAAGLFSLAGKTALVTGASSGLGARFARVLAAWGAEVTLAARRTDRLRALAGEIEAAGGRARAVAMDVTDAASVEAAFEAAGALDILVNNAGVGEGTLLINTPDADWRAVMDVNLDGAFRVAREAARGMRETGGGSIVNIASVLSFEVQKGSGAYAAAKAGVLQMTRTMAIELARHRIRVNAIAPGYFESEMTAAYFASPAGQEMIRHLPPGRPGDPSELDGALLLLASDAGAYMTGAAVTVDGGHSLLMP